MYGGYDGKHHTDPLRLHRVVTSTSFSAWTCSRPIKLASTLRRTSYVYGAGKCLFYRNTNYLGAPSTKLGNWWKMALPKQEGRHHQEQDRHLPHHLRQTSLAQVARSDLLQRDNRVGIHRSYRLRLGIQAVNGLSQRRTSRR